MLDVDILGERLRRTRFTQQILTHGQRLAFAIDSAYAAARAAVAAARGFWRSGPLSATCSTKLSLRTRRWSSASKTPRPESTPPSKRGGRSSCGFACTTIASSEKISKTLLRSEGNEPQLHLDHNLRALSASLVTAAGDRSTLAPLSHEERAYHTLACIASLRREEVFFFLPLDVLAASTAASTPLYVCGAIAAWGGSREYRQIICTAQAPAFAQHFSTLPPQHRARVTLV